MGNVLGSEQRVEGFLDSEDCPFDYRAYADRYSDLKNTFGYDKTKLTNHWNTNGKREGRNPCSDTGSWGCKFDWMSYRNRYADLGQMNQEQLMEHWNTTGKKEGRNPCTDTGRNCDFDAKAYLARYPDLRNAFGTNEWRAMDHWNAFGRRENRNPCGSTVSRGVLTDLLNVTDARNNNVPFIRDVLVREKATAEDLISAAKRIAPVAQKTKDLDTAYNSAYEADTPPPAPGKMGTLQGFALYTFFIAYAVFAVMLVVTYYNVTGNTTLSLVGVVLFAVLGAVIYAVLRRYG